MPRSSIPKLHNRQYSDLPVVRFVFGQSSGQLTLNFIIGRLTFEGVWRSYKSHAVPVPRSALGYMDSPKLILSGQSGVKSATDVGL